jgi:hypothetical protein
MKAILSSFAALLALFASQALAQTCNNSDRITATAIQTALGGQWFCAQTAAGDPNSMWREYIPNALTGTFKECHSGLPTGPDPIDNNKGTFTIGGGSSSHGTIEFDYGGSNSYSYYVCTVTAGSHYVFRNTANSSLLFDVYISSCPSSGISTAQKTSCPP